LKKAVAFLIWAACLLSACDSATGAATSTLALSGNWSYTATQTSPTVVISGTLHIDQTGATMFTGAANFTETDALGMVRQRVGQLTGQTVSSDAIDFDVFIDATTRRHVARVQADSMSGTWALTAGGTGTGSFKAKKL
jgi:hypothetical protein